MKPIRVHRDNLAKHGVSAEEVRQCFFTRNPRYERKARKGVFQLLAQTADGRYLEILYRDLATEYFVFHAMDARLFQVKLLKRRGKRR